MIIHYLIVGELVTLWAVMSYSGGSSSKSMFVLCLAATMMTLMWPVVLGNIFGGLLLNMSKKR